MAHFWFLTDYAAKAPMPLKVFLSHNRADKPEVEALAQRLRREHGIEPWLDKWNLIPGQPWQEEIEDAMRECDCCAVFIGRGDPEHGVLGPWQNAEMRALINRQISEHGARFGVIPVLLPGAEHIPRGRLPTFLVANMWVEFRHGLDDSEAFGRLLAGIRRERPGPPERVPADTGRFPYPPAPRICNLPASIGSLFKGREEFLDRLHRGFQEGSGAKAAAIIATQALHGLGGIGKTRAAIEYARRHGAEYSALLLVRADSEMTLRANLANLADPLVLDLPEHTAPDEEARLTAVLRWLDARPGWLLIADNVDTGEAAAAVEDFLGRFRSGHVLITSRLSGWSGQVRRLDLQVLEERDAVGFLLERSGRSQTAVEKESAKALAARLDGLALALEQAGAHIAERGISFARYLEIFDARRREVLEWHDGRLMRYPVSVAVTWLTSFEQLSTPARRLLDSLAFLAPDPIPRSMVEKGGEGPALEDALVELSRYSLVRFLDEPPDTFSIHRLVQEIVRGRLGGTGREAWEEAVDLLLLEAPGSAQDVSTWNVWRRLAPHCAAVLDGTEWWSVSVSVSRLMNGYAIFLHFANADYAGAETLYRRALEAMERVLGPEHPDTLTSLSNLAALLHDKGDYAGAETLCRRALEGRERVLGPEHPDTLNSLSNLAALLHDKGDHAGAEPLLRRALEAMERILGPEHSDTLTSLGNLASLLRAKGDHAGAEPLYRRALEGRERVLGPEHSDTLNSLNNLAALLYAKGDRAGAEPLHRQALEGRERVLGPEHPHTVNSLSNLATLLHDKGDHAGAEPLYRRALERRERVLGPEHPDTLASLNSLAALLRAKGDHAGAEPLLRRALEAMERILGPEHPLTLVSLGNLAELLRAKGDHAGAEPLYRRTLEAMECILGPEHPLALVSLGNLAALLHDKGDHAGAETLLRRALEAMERVLEPEHPDTLNSRGNLAALLHDKGDHAGAEPLFRRALKAMERILGPEHSDTLTSLGNLASLLRDKGDHAGAEPLYRRALEAMERILGPEHPLALVSLGNLAELLRAKGDHAGAEPLYRRALEAMERVLGPEHPDTLTSLGNLASLLKFMDTSSRNQKRYSRAFYGKLWSSQRAFTRWPALRHSGKCSKLISRLWHSLRSAFRRTQ